MVNPFQIIYLYISLFFKILNVKIIYIPKLINELKYNAGTNNFTFNETQIKRISYYCILNTITNDWFSTLRGYKVDKIERQTALYIGALTPLSDDLTDDLKIKSADILDNPDKYNESFHETLPLIKYIYSKLKNSNNSNFLKYAFKTIQAQDNSLIQLEDEKKDFNSILQITKLKGGASILLYRSALNNPIKTAEKEAIFQSGYVLQLINDMFDIFKDYYNQQQTIFTNTHDIEYCKKIYNQQKDVMISLFSECEYPYKNIKKCLYKISTIIGRGDVCINQLFENYIRNNQHLKIEEFKRKDFICDMEKISNILLSIKYSIIFCKKIKKKNKNIQSKKSK